MNKNINNPGMITNTIIHQQHQAGAPQGFINNDYGGGGGSSGGDGGFVLMGSDHRIKDNNGPANEKRKRARTSLTEYSEPPNHFVENPKWLANSNRTSRIATAAATATSVNTTATATAANTTAASTTTASSSSF